MSKVMLITGASRGIGAATAIGAGARGYKVAVNYRSSAGRAAEVVRRITDGNGVAIAVQANAADEAEILKLFETVERELGPIEALVNNAGIVGAPAGRVEAVTVEQLQEIFEINSIGPFLCAREAVKRMSTKHGGQGGAIVNVSSAASRLGSPNEFVHYAASKGAIDSFTLGLAKEVAAEGIRVNAVRPGLIDTEIHDSSGIEGRLERLAPTTPIGRAGSAEETANTILWLLSDEASYVTGALLDVAGGR